MQESLYHDKSVNLRYYNFFNNIPKRLPLYKLLKYFFVSHLFLQRSSAECLDSALNVLARALENNKDNSEIWCHYLKLFSKRGLKEEVQEMCETAVEYAPTYKIWWTVSYILFI